VSELTAHDHGNCELCDAVERKLAEAQAELSAEKFELVLLRADEQTAKEKFSRDEKTITELAKERDALRAKLEQVREAAYRECKDAIYAVFARGEASGVHVSLDEVITEIAKACALAALDAGKEAGG